MERILKPVVIITEVLLFLLMASCDIRTPYVGKTFVSIISTTEVTFWSQIIWTGGAEIKELGFCWNTSGHPTKADSFIKTEAKNNKFYGQLKDLSPGTVYYIRSYAINREGIYYSQVMIFTTGISELPSISSTYADYVTHDEVHSIVGGITDNTNNLLTKGFCWSTLINPTTDDSFVELDADSEGFSHTIEGLNPGTVYYIRAFASNIVGKVYGENLVIKTFDGFTTDYEGNVYSTVRLGNQEWMTRNLRTTYFSNGDKIKTTDPHNLNIELEVNPVYQWGPTGVANSEYLNDDGRQYTWYAATDSRNLCPTGWHVPSVAEWDELLVHLGGDSLTARDFRWCNNINWDSPDNTSATEGSFCAIMANWRNYNPGFGYDNFSAWWSGTESSSENSYAIRCYPDFDTVIISENNNKKNGYQIRCVKD